MDLRNRRSYSHIEKDYQDQVALFKAQTEPVQQFFREQARGISTAVLQNASLVRFQIPENLNQPNGNGDCMRVTTPEGQRQQLASSHIGWFSQTYLDNALRRRLIELEHSPEPGLAIAARLLHYTVAIHMIYQVLPSGRSVKYLAGEGEEIPSIPYPLLDDKRPALVASTDAIGEPGTDDENRSELQVPYTPWARHFYIPAWIAFDERDRMLVATSTAAVACLESMQNFMNVLQTAIDLAPYMVADPAYQEKRYGMLGQLVNQGHSYARFQTNEIIATIQRRAEANDLNRGLSLSLPYFDDQALAIETREFLVTPAGRVMFLPSFVVLAAVKEQARVTQDFSLSPSTRKHLLGNLKMLEGAFR